MTVEDEAGYEVSCVTVVQIGGVQPSFLNCQANSTIGVDVGQSVTIELSDVLSYGPFPSWNLTLVVTDDNGDVVQNNMIDDSYIGQSLTATVTDPATGAQCTSNLEVTAPTLMCNNFVIVSLGIDGTAQITPDMVAEGPLNADTAWLSQSLFTCDDVGMHSIILYATTGSTTLSCSSTITIEDKSAPVVICESYINLPLDDTGHATLTTDMVDDGTWDNCGIATLILDQTDFDCNSSSVEIVKLTATDPSGLSTSCWTEVNILGVPGTALACVGESIIGISDGESVFLNPDDLTEMGSLACWDLSLNLTDIDGNPIANDEITYDHAGDTLIAIISDNNSTLTCWSYIIVFGIDCADFNICDTQPWNTPIGDCTSGHTYDDFVEWPADITVTTCYYSPDYLRDFTTVGANNAHPQILGTCDNVVVGYQDEIFTVVPVGDLKIIRKWTVVDFTDPMEVWHYNQVLLIYLIDCLSDVDVNSFAGVPVPDVNIYSGVYTDDQGKATIEDPAHNYFVPTMVSDSYLNGLDMHDVQMIQEYISGLRFLNDFQLTAADVNADGDIDIRDIIDLKNYIEEKTPTPTETDWFFIGNQYDDFDSELSEPIAAGDYYGDQLKVLGVKRGDLNGDANAFGQANELVSLHEINLYVKDRLLNTGESYIIDISVDDMTHISGQQLELFFDFNHMELDDMSSMTIPGFDESNYSIDKVNNKISILWYGDEDVLLNGGVESMKTLPLLSMTVRANKNGIFSQEFDIVSSSRNSTARINDNARYVFKLEWVDRIISNTVDPSGLNRKVDIYPNPTANTATIKIADDPGESYVLKITNVTGKQVVCQEVEGEFILSTQYWHNGLYYISMYGESGFMYSGTLSVQH